MKLDEPVTNGEVGRKDAFHVAAVLVTCDHRISPGQSIRFTDTSFTKVTSDGVTIETRHGIVNPFQVICFTINVGEKFWVLLNPGTVEDLTHSFKIPTKGIPSKIDEVKEDPMKVTRLEEQIENLLRENQRLSSEIENVEYDNRHSSNRYVYPDEDNGCRGC